MATSPRTTQPTPGGEPKFGTPKPGGILPQDPTHPGLRPDPRIIPDQPSAPSAPATPVATPETPPPTTQPGEPTTGTYMDVLYQMFAQFGMGDLAAAIAKLAVDPTLTDAQRYLAVYELPEYKARFPAMAELQKQGIAITEGQYVQQEYQYTMTLRDAGLPQGFYDSHQDFANWMTKGVSPNELQSRIAAAQRVVDSADPSLRDSALNLYGLDSGHLLAYVIDPNKAQPFIDKQMRAIEMGAAAQRNQFSIDKTMAESLGGNPALEGANPGSLNNAFANARLQANQDKRLSSIEGTAYSETDAIKSSVLNDVETSLASQQRAQREQARFGGSSAVSAKTLNSGGI